MSATAATSTMKSRAKKAGFWVLMSHGSGQVLRLLSSLIMTRFLVPEAYGLMSIVMVIITGMTLFSDIGINLQLVRSDRIDEPRFVNTAWTLQIIRGFAIAIFCLIVSLVVHLGSLFDYLPEGTVYSDPQLKYIIAVMALYPVILGFESTKAITALRNLDQFRLAISEISTQIIALICSVLWARYDPTVWALVFSCLIGGLIRTIFSHAFLVGIPNKLAFCRDSLKELYGFGVWVFFSTILTFFVSNGDRIFLSSYLGATDFGIYNVGFNIFLAFRSVSSTLFSKVAYPVLSEKVRNDLKEAPIIFYKIRNKLDIFVFLTCGFLYFAGPELIGLLYDNRYAGAGLYLSILSILLISDRYCVAEFYLISLGLSKFIFQFNLIRCISMYAFVPVVYFLFGSKYVVWAVVASTFTVVPYLLFVSNGHGFLRIKKEFLTFPLLIVGGALGLLFNIYVIDAFRNLIVFFRENYFVLKSLLL